jgi:Zinc finger, C3HC4 type (RING finger)
MKAVTQFERQQAASRFVETAEDETSFNDKQHCSDDTDEEDDNKSNDENVNAMLTSGNHTSNRTSNTRQKKRKVYNDPSTKGTIAMRRSLEKLRQTLLCSICNNVYLDPVTIQCGHTFCCSCIDRHSDNNWNCPSTYKILLFYYVSRLCT